MTPKSGFGGNKQATIIEVNASAKPSEVVSAVLRGADAPRSASTNRDRPIQFAFLFVVVFALIVYFRQEIWSMSRDVSKHPIMGYAEQLQIRHYLGTQWLFGTGKDITAEEIEVAKLTATDGSKEAANTTATPAAAATPATAATPAAVTASPKSDTQASSKSDTATDNTGSQSAATQAVNATGRALTRRARQLLL